MRTNVAGFALAVGMGCIVVLLGLLALSVAGLTELAPGLAAETQEPAATELPVGEPVVPVRAGAPGPLTAEQAAGGALFANSCSQCHAVNEKVVGPALAGINKRRPIGWVVQWVQNSAKVIASDDAYAVKLFNDNGRQQMPSFPQLTDQQIRSIVAWVGTQEGTAPAQPAGAVVAAR